MANVDLEQDVDHVSRRPFVREFGREYQPGQHVTFLGPSGRGKTRLAAELLAAVKQHKPDIEVVALHGKIKGRDRTIEMFANRMNARIIRKWPPGNWDKYRARKSRTYVLRPLNKAGENPDEENAKLRVQYRKAIHHGYQSSRKKPVILLADEAHQTHTDLKLMRDCEGPLMRGRPVCAMWSLVQRGRYVSYHVYDQAEHVFMFYDPDRNNQQRYSEIGDVDPKQLVELSRQLKTETVADGSTISEALYFRRSGNQLAIVGI
jgi:energy-coupling factor transporter ATP-binding protein EcfA2